MPDDQPRDDREPDDRQNNRFDVVEALDEMVTVLEATCAESQTAAAEATLLRERSRTGSLLHETLRSEGGPALVQRVSALQHRLSGAASRLRRVQARRLHREGLTTERIAEIFGVSRQRISALLRDTGTTSPEAS